MDQISATKSVAFGDFIVLYYACITAKYKSKAHFFFHVQ